MTIAIMLKELSHNDVISKDEFAHVKDNILKINREKLDDYDGKSLGQNINKYL